MGKIWDWIKDKYWKYEAMQERDGVGGSLMDKVQEVYRDLTGNHENPLYDVVETENGKEIVKKGEETAKPDYPTTEMPTIETPTIRTDEEEQTPINTQSVQQLIEEYQQKQWQREDKIRKETQEREDTAYQRAVEDMRNAGINPNLMNVQPASAGGGITSATGVDTSTLNTTITADTQTYINEMDRVLEEWITIINKDTTMDQGTKNRWIETLKTGLQTLASFYMAKKLGMKTK